METISVSCNHCGAPLEIPKGTRFLTCNYCSSRLEVRQSEGATYTSVLEAIEGHAAQMAEDLGVIRLQNELEQLDRQWMMDRQPYLKQDKDGNITEPTSPLQVLPAVLFVGLFVFVCLAMGVAAMGMASRWPGPGGPGIFACVPFGMAAVAIVAVICGFLSQTKKADEYAAKKRAYDERRAQLVQQIADRTPTTGRPASS